MLDGKNIIGYNRSKRGSHTFKTFNPILNIENKTQFYEASAEEIEEALTLAHQASTFYRRYQL